MEIMEMRDQDWVPITSQGVKNTIFLSLLAFVRVREMGCSV
jgi:hypothetical protein